jgi:hypothetical protein
MRPWGYVIAAYLSAAALYGGYVSYLLANERRLSGRRGGRAR